ncbi:hybrid sensor histidine kinase/response regulator transcription factor [Hymenobacter sp.]|jgi:signal transduction histidine kinase/ligand-binding sensor domain-containing protein/DNA-binding response OmpR family regulator|uniref:hybrid sensor histidine kinase/response regulator transcription factor n=1 Tax=Hymenobacter sp. TaxID=1898978 RepID=UPI002EDB6DA1
MAYPAASLLPATHPPVQVPLPIKWLLTFLSFLCLGLGSAWAQNAAASGFRFEHLTVDQGLSHSDGMAVTQDQAGFIWVGTNRGLDRYDGYSLKQYSLPVNQQSRISGNRIKVVYTAPNGRLWVGAERSGLSFYDADHDTFLGFDAHYVPATYRPLARLLAQSDVTAITADPQGRLWAATYRDGLFVLSFNQQGQLQQLQQLPPLVNGQSSLRWITSLALDPEGNLWVGTLGAGLRLVRTTEPGLPVLATGLTTAIRILHLDQRGDFWIGTDWQVFWVAAANRRTRRELTTHPLPERLSMPQSILLDSFGRLWVGTTYGLHVWEAGAVTNRTPPLLATPPTSFLPQDGEPFSINSERIHQIFEDRNQIVWLCASAGGLNKVDLRQKPFGRIRQPLIGRLSRSNNYINTIYKEEAQHTLWFGTRNGMASYDLRQHTYRNYLNQQGNGTRGIDVSAIFQTSNGTLWFGTRNNGLVTLVRTTGEPKLTTYTALPDGTNLSQTSIERITQDKQGTVWVATFSAGLLRFSASGQYLGAFRTDNSALPTNQFTFLLYDQGRDVFWASTHDAGLLKLRFAADSVQVLGHYQAGIGKPNSLQVNYVWPLLLDEQGTLWIGTIGGGLHQLVTDAQGRETIRSYAKQLPESDVESILADDAGNLWMGGTGLYRFTPRTRQYLRYDVADGLQSNSFKIGAACRAQDGTLYFGGINGINYFQPQAIQTNPYPPVVQITSLRVTNKPVTVGSTFNGRVLLEKALSKPQTVTIKDADNDFAVEFVALNYTNPQKNRYAYRLVGYNEEWVYPAPGQRTASFANLPAGHYTLQIKASNGEGVWSRKYATMQFEVLAPWWRTWWAYLLYGLAALGVVALYRRFEMAQQQLENQLVLKQFQAEKEKELTDLKLGFFTNVSHELRTPLTLILGPMEEIIEANGAVPGLRDKIQLMHKQTRKLFDLVNQLLDFRKVESGNVPLRATYGDAVQFLQDIYLVFKLKAEERGIAYTLDLPAEPVPLYFDRSKLEIVLTNLLANAFKYTSEGRGIRFAATVIGNPGGEAVFQEGQLTGNYLEVNVCDQGTGIKAEELSHIFDPYYQASHTDTLRMTGTGIGLSLVKQFAERHGGTVSVESVVGVGTTFRLRLPFGQAHLRPGDIQPEAPTSPAETQKLSLLADEVTLELSAENLQCASTLPRLLVVEDNDEVRQYLQQLFEAEYEVLLAVDGLEGWEQALLHTPDLIISDVMMPRSDGLELCQKIKKHPKTAHIPVLLLTARTAALHELEGLGTGADDYVSKPFNPALLQAKATTLLRNRNKLREYYQRQILLEPTDVVIADADREFLENAMGVVEKHLDDPGFSVQVLVREVGMSQSVFYRRIKGITGQTAVEFIRDVRMKRAAQLLAQTRLRVTEVAFQVGIEDAKYFRKAFQKIFTLSPSEYAKQHRQSREAASTAL